MSRAPVLSLRHPVARLVRPLTLAAVLCAGGAFTAWAEAPAAALQEVQQLMQAGKHSEAAKRVQRHLKLSPQDVQLRFLQGVIAAEQNQRDAAIQAFTALTHDHPQLPEPYNNLAVLYAAKGDDRKAAQALEQALATNRSYATAHKNLGDLYARMASDAYAKALLLDSTTNRPAPAKLALIGGLHTSTTASPLAGLASAAPTTPSVTPAAPTQPALSATAVAEAAKPTTKPADKPVAATTLAVVAAPPTTGSAALGAPTLAPGAPVVGSSSLNQPKPAATAAAVAVAPAKTAEPADKPREKVATDPVASDKAKKEQQAHADVESTVHAWARAWAKQDMAGYFATYSPQFAPAGGESLAKWKTDRKDRIVGKPTITVQVRDLRVNVQGSRASASFRQYYASGSFKATTRKVLRMQQEGHKWLIVREETGA